MTKTTAQASPVVFYDGGCPLCRREIGHYQGLDKRGRIRWVDIHAHPASLQPYGIDWENAMQRFHLLEPDGRMMTGAYAFAALWKQLPYYRLLAVIVSIPGMLFLLDKLYTAFSRWRWKKRCTEACIIPRPTAGE